MSTKPSPVEAAANVASPEGNEQSLSCWSFDRRSFLTRVGCSAAVAATVGMPGFEGAAADASLSGLQSDPGAANRRRAAFAMRRDMATVARIAPAQSIQLTVTSGETEKGTRTSPTTPRDCRRHTGASIARLVRDTPAAISSGGPEDFEAISLGLGRELENPQEGVAFDLEGADSHHLHEPPPPALQRRAGGRNRELYWMALRDVNFDTYDSEPVIERAATDLSLLSDFHGPRIHGKVTSATIFRGATSGDVTGPFMSQFLLKDVLFGATRSAARSVHVARRRPHDGLSRLARRAGAEPVIHRTSLTRRLATSATFATLPSGYTSTPFTRRISPCLILLAQNTPLGPGLPLNHSRTQTGFVEFGAPHIMSLVTEVATRALKAQWFQKWWVLGVLRPEEFAGRVYHQKAGAADYPIHDDLFNSPSLTNRGQARYTPIADGFPRGLADASCLWFRSRDRRGRVCDDPQGVFRQSATIDDPKVPNQDDAELVDYTDQVPLTVLGELNKVASNVATGRNAAGVHWRTDFTGAITLGEEVAISILDEQNMSQPVVHLESRRFDGTPTTI